MTMVGIINLDVGQAISLKLGCLNLCDSQEFASQTPSETLICTLPHGCSLGTHTWHQGTSK
jgi:hypothetical protein